MKKIILLIFTIILLNACTNGKKVVIEKVIKVGEKSIYEMPFDNKEYPNASIAILLNKIEMKINSNNTIEIKERIVKKIINYAGKKDYSEFKISYDKRYEKVDILEAMTIKKDGSKIKLSNDDIKVLDDQSDYWKQDFAVRKIVIVPFKSVEIGDFLDITYIKTSKKEEKISTYFTFADIEPTLKKDITITYPYDKYIKFTKKNWSNNIIASEIEKEGNIIYNLKMKNLQQVLLENNMPNISEIFPTVYFTTYQNWDEYKTEIYDIYRTYNLMTKEVKEISDKICLDSDSKYKKVEQIKNYLAKNIKFMPIYDLKKFKIREMTEVIKKGYGNSFERAILFKQMLDFQKVENEIIILGPKKNKFEKQKDLLLNKQFDYVINEITIDNKKYYVDTISEFYDLNELEYENRIGFSIKKNLEFIEINGREENKIGMILKGKVDENKSIMLSIETKYSGNEEAVIRENYKYMTPKDKEIDFQTRLGSISLEISPMTRGFVFDLGKSVSKFYAYKQDDFAMATDEFIYFDIPLNLELVRLLYDANDRKYDFENQESYKKTMDFELEIPKKYEILEMPKSIEIENNIMKVTRNIKLEENKIMIKDVMELKEGIIKLKNYAEFYEEVNRLAKKENKRILLKSKINRF